MAIGITKTTRGGVHTITGPGFYARTAAGADGLPDVVDLRYISGSAFVPEVAGETLWISDVSTLSMFTGIAVDATTDAQRELELFIRVLYVLGCDLNGGGGDFNLHTEMLAGGRVTHMLSNNLYNRIEVFDFMAMTGAIEYPFNRLLPGQPRPLVQDATVGDIEVMKGAIRKLGIFPYAVHIAGEYGIDFEEMTEILVEYMPTVGERQVFFSSYIVPILRQKGFRLLTAADYAIITA
jgi:hypothetical protein